MGVPVDGYWYPDGCFSSFFEQTQYSENEKISVDGLYANWYAPAPSPS